MANLYNLIAKGTGGETIQVAAIDNDYLNKAAHDLLNSKGGSIVISGSNDANIQLLINAINVLLENYSID